MKIPATRTFPPSMAVNWRSQTGWSGGQRPPFFFSGEVRKGRNASPKPSIPSQWSARNRPTMRPTVTGVISRIRMNSPLAAAKLALHGNFKYSTSTKLVVIIPRGIVHQDDLQRPVLHLTQSSQHFADIVPSIPAEKDDRNKRKMG